MPPRSRNGARRLSIWPPSTRRSARIPLRGPFRPSLIIRTCSLGPCRRDLGMARGACRSGRPRRGDQHAFPSGVRSRPSLIIRTRSLGPCRIPSLRLGTPKLASRSDKIGMPRFSLDAISFSPGSLVKQNRQIGGQHDFEKRRSELSTKTSRATNTWSLTNRISTQRSTRCATARAPNSLRPKRSAERSAGQIRARHSSQARTLHDRHHPYRQNRENYAEHRQNAHGHGCGELHRPDQAPKITASAARSCRIGSGRWPQARQRAWCSSR